MICLDSSFIIDYLKGNSEAKQAYEQLQHEGFVITELNIFEVSIGYFNHMKKTKQDNPFHGFIDFINNFTILPMTNLFSVDAATHYASLMGKGKTIGITDCLIAGTMQANGVTTILTRNKKHFSRLSGINPITY